MRQIELKPLSINKSFKSLYGKVKLLNRICDFVIQKVCDKSTYNGSSGQREGDEESYQGYIKVCYKTFPTQQTGTENEPKCHKTSSDDEIQQKNTNIVRGKKSRLARQYDRSNLKPAIDAFREGKMSLRQASREFQVPASTLHDMASGKLEVTQDGKRGPKAALSKDQEQEILNCIAEADGRLCTFENLQEYTKEVIEKHGLESRFRDGQPSLEWFKVFVRRHPELRKRKLIEPGFFSGNSNRKECVESQTGKRKPKLSKFVREAKDISKKKMVSVPSSPLISGKPGPISDNTLFPNPETTGLVLGGNLLSQNLLTQSGPDLISPDPTKVLALEVPTDDMVSDQSHVSDMGALSQLVTPPAPGTRRNYTPSKPQCPNPSAMPSPLGFSIPKLVFTQNDSCTILGLPEEKALVSTTHNLYSLVSTDSSAFSPCNQSFPGQTSEAIEDTTSKTGHIVTVAIKPADIFKECPDTSLDTETNRVTLPSSTLTSEISNSVASTLLNPEVTTSIPDAILSPSATLSLVDSSLSPGAKVSVPPAVLSSDEMVTSQNSALSPGVSNDLLQIVNEHMDLDT